MRDPLVFITEPNAQRRLKVQTIMQRVPGVTVSTFDSFGTMKKAVRNKRPHLIIGPWAQGGETLLSARMSVVGSAVMGADIPQLLLLTDRVSPARISLARQAGNAELIPSDPLDYTGLFNRAVLLLCGSDGLYKTLPKRDMPELNDLLENMPALKRRLAA